MSTLSREQFIKDLEYVDDTQGPLNHLSQSAQVVLSHYDHLQAENAAQRAEIEGLRAEVNRLQSYHEDQANCYAVVKQQLATAQARVEELTKEKDKWAELAGSFTASQHKYLGEMEQLKRQLDQAFGLLRELADLQNGAPLPKYEQEWEACMVNVHKALTTFEATPEPPRG